MLSPGHPAKAEDVKITIDGYAQGRSVEGPVYYSGLISNSCSSARDGEINGGVLP
jgi:hypothetical protein